MAKYNQSKYIDCDTFNEYCIEVTNLNKNDYVPHQLSSQILYRYPEVSLPCELSFRTPFVELIYNGIPHISDYYKTDDQRSFIKLTLDPKRDDAKPFIQLFEKIDNYIITHKNTILGNHHEKYEYLPCIKQSGGIAGKSQEHDDFVAENKKKKSHEYKYVKLRIGRNFNTKKILTHIFVRDNIEDSPKKIEPKNIDELSEYLVNGAKIRMIISVTKLWADEFNSNSEYKHKFGIIMKVMNMDIIQSKTKENKTDTFADYAFD